MQYVIHLQNRTIRHKHFTATTAKNIQLHGYELSHNTDNAHHGFLNTPQDLTPLEVEANSTSDDPNSPPTPPLPLSPSYRAAAPLRAARGSAWASAPPSRHDPPPPHPRSSILTPRCRSCEAERRPWDAGDSGPGGDSSSRAGNRRRPGPTGAAPPSGSLGER